MFDLIWVVGWSVLVLPVSVAVLLGWVPRRVRRRVSPWGMRVRGAALLVFWASGMVVPLAGWGGLDAEDRTFLAVPIQFGLMMFGAGMICGSELGEWFYRQAMRSRFLDEARGESVRERGPESAG